MYSFSSTFIIIYLLILAEMGDYVESYNNNSSYFQSRKFFPHQNEEHEAKIMDYHKNHV